MTERIVTFCDNCNVDQENSKIFFLGPTVEAVKVGWLECDYGIQCPTCAAADVESARLDEETGVFHGASLEAANAIAEIIQLSRASTKTEKKAP